MAHYTISDFIGADIISICDVTERVDELRSTLDAIKEEFDSVPENEGVDFANIARNHPDFSSEEYDELQKLEELLSDLCGYGGDEQWEGDWYPATLIAESHFEQAMDEMISDCYPDLSKNLPCFATVTLDYDMLKQDYSEVDFEGTTYYYR